MILAIDVQYGEDSAVAAGVVFERWDSTAVTKEVTTPIDTVAPYEPGAFYKRELPCILAVMEAVKLPISMVIVDGFVNLGEEEKPGLGQHLYSYLEGKMPVVGVAKKPFAGTPSKCEVLRGQSSKPLYVTAVGLSLAEAKKGVLTMEGKHRLPTMLKRVDQLCRGLN
ncbi:endonuclease V [Thaumasiovibrio subtropicus]|uniref:endonuclease V n=1 Tax=Thaumasiovibrio subtropicus TaxID=1891207 RepID=UPI000B3646B9|nr:endonuclease V [Thaumasiovibrio subtropicus]